MKKTFPRAFLTPQTLFLLVFLVFLTSAAQPSGAATFPCAGSLNVSRFRLLIQPAKGGTPLPLQDINIVEAGEKLKYEPLHIPPAIRDKAKIALFLVAVPKAESKDEAKGKAEEDKEGSEKEETEKEEKKEAKQDIHVLEARPAKDPQEWEVPARATVVGVVFGPHGLDVKKVSSMVIKNPDLIPELTEYAEANGQGGSPG